MVSTYVRLPAKTCCTVSDFVPERHLANCSADLTAAADQIGVADPFAERHPEVLQIAVVADQIEVVAGPSEKYHLQTDPVHSTVGRIGEADRPQIDQERSSVDHVDLERDHRRLDGQC
jgi:hypothetical protein